MLNDAAVKALLLQKTTVALVGQNIDLYIGDSKVSTTFGGAAENTANILFDFWKKYGRTPVILFNDGLPESWVSELKVKPAFKSIIGASISADYVQELGTEEQSQVQVNVSLPVLACKVSIPGFYQTKTNFYVDGVTDAGEFGHEVTDTKYISGYFNDLGDIPLDKVAAGAFQTWGVLLVIYSHPEFVYATDEGMLLTRDGVAMLRKSLAYWFLNFMHREILGGREININDYLGTGPVTETFPYALLEAMRKQLEAMKAASGGTLGFFKFILEMIVTFVGFYFGAAGLAGTIGGTFTIANLSADVSLASKFGVDTGQLGSALKIIGLTAGDNIIDTVFNSGAPVDDIDFGTIDIADFSEIGDFPDLTNGFDLSDLAAPDFSQLSDNDFELSVGTAPDISFDDLGFDETLPIESTIDEGALEGFGDAPIYDPIAAGDANEAALARAMGPMSPEQYATAAKASTSVLGAAQTALKLSGSQSGQTNITPQQIANAKAVAKNNALAAKENNDSTGTSIWSAANNLLNMYGNYQAQSLKAKTTFPRTTTYPSTSGQAVRQPDGSVTVRHADGSMTTIKPSGQSIMTPLGGLLPSFSIQTGMILAASAIALGAFFIFRKR